MRPTYAHCNSCHSRISIFGEDKPENCPKCSTLLRYEEFGACEGCKAKVTLGTKMCVSCRMTSDPVFPGGLPGVSPGSRGGVNG